MEKNNPNPAVKPTVLNSSSGNSHRSQTDGAESSNSNSNHTIVTPNAAGFEEAKRIIKQALAEKKTILNRRFILQSKLGSGGMGIVYKAYDIRKLEVRDPNPYIAIKVLNNDFQQNPNSYVVLQREAARTSKISHPNIVTVHDCDRDGRNIFMTMELLEGEDLDSYMRKLRGIGLPVEDALKIVREYCDALEYAHKHNIIHCDLKPGNIYISKQGIKVLDFGIARITADVQISQDFDAAVLGGYTPAYASLELIEHKASPHPSDDVYAAAIIAYELFAGEHPYNRKQADIALDEGLKPKRIKKLSKRQWKALKAGLQLTRQKRTKSIKALIDELTLKKKLPVFKVVSLLLLIAVGWFVFIQIKTMGNSEKTYADGRQCFENKDFGCAIEKANILLGLTPPHKHAQKLLDAANKAKLLERVALLFEKANICLDQNDTVCAHDFLRDIVRQAPKAPNIAGLREAIAAKEQENQFRQILLSTTECYKNKDYKCVLSASGSFNSVISSGPEKTSIYAKELSNKIAILFTKAASNDEKNNINYEINMKKGREYFKQKNYSQSLKFSKLALQDKQGDANAKKLEQKSIYAQFASEETLKKVKRIMQRANRYYTRGELDSAISSADAALDLEPNFSAALELKAKAEKDKIIQDTAITNSLTIEVE